MAELVAAARAAGLPEPFHLIAHSMGGCIGLRALHEGLPVRSAVFSAPMWGIRIHAAARPLAWALGAGARASRRGHLYAPGTGPVTYVLGAEAPGNVLTTDPAMYDFMQRQVRAHPGLALGGPTLNWLLEALRETRALAALTPPALPCLCMMGGNERVVDAGRIRSVMARWPGGRLEVIPGAEHEMMMETPATRRRFYDGAAALFDARS
ncbi:alpha/beta hydrolase [Frigidibacter albus]